MNKRSYFDTFHGAGWPTLSQLAPYFLSPPGQRWNFGGGNDGASLKVTGADGTDHLGANKGRIDVGLQMWGNPELGVLLIYTKRGGGVDEAYSSKGNLSRLREWIRTAHEDRMPVGLFIPFAMAWKAVKEFIETDGKRSSSIEWVANRDLPENTFPDP